MNRNLSICNIENLKKKCTHTVVFRIMKLGTEETVERFENPQKQNFKVGMVTKGFVKSKNMFLKRI